jgi:hypothetical protein
MNQGVGLPHPAPSKLSPRASPPPARPARSGPGRPSQAAALAVAFFCGEAPSGRS